MPEKEESRNEWGVVGTSTGHCYTEIKSLSLPALYERKERSLH